MTELAKSQNDLAAFREPVQTQNHIKKRKKQAHSFFEKYKENEEAMNLLKDKMK